MILDQIRRRALILLVLPALALMLSGLRAPLGGSHVFRQAHVAANIDKFVEAGVSLRPATYNEDVPYAAFDFPLYQLLVASLARVVPLEPLVLARLTSCLLFVLALLAVDRLLVGAGIRRWPRAAALACFAYAPLDLFYFQAPMVDGLAVLLALVSLAAYVRAPEARVRSGSGAALLLSAFLSTLIKSPVYLPVFVAIEWHRARTRGLRALTGFESVALALVAALGVLLFKLYWMLVNGSAVALSPWERRHYFGTLGERVSLASWTPVVTDLLHLTSTPVMAVFAVLGALWWVCRGRGRTAAVFTGLLVGCGVTLLVFFDRYPPHNYYQLPFVFPLAFFAAQGLQALRVRARAARHSSRPRRWLFAGALPVVVLAAAFFSWSGFRALAGSNRAVELIRSRGAWIREHTRPDDYVVYLFEGSADDWNPAYLYFARRNGYNLPLGELGPPELAALSARARGRFPRVLVFASAVGARQELLDLGAELLASDPRRALLRVDALAAAPGTDASGPR